MTHKLQRLLNNNKQWVQSKLQIDPEFFTKLSATHTPEFLWIGCSDARMPANNLVGLEAGEVFVHRNVGNVVCPNDENIRAVIGYAIEVLQVKHIIVAGHYGCGAVNAALTAGNFGTVDNWLQNIQQVINTNSHILNGLPEQQQQKTLVKLNIKAQLHNLSETEMVKNAWKNKQDLTIHGWLYNIENGLLSDLYCIDNPDHSDILKTTPLADDC